jgi:cytochrome c oxidase subunit 3
MLLKWGYNNQKKRLWLELLEERERGYFAYIPRASPWPFLTSEALSGLLLSTVSWLHYYVYGLVFTLTWLFALCLIISFWFKDLIIEGQYIGVYMKKNIRSIRLGFGLFLISEAMFFFALFWSYFHFSLNPSVWIGSVWPPYGMETISPFKLPLLNTMILVTSGITLTYTQKIISRNTGNSRYDAIKGFLLTLFLAVSFILIQRYEFIHAPFSINDSVYGSIFFFITGFHGIHVIAGTVFIFVCFLRFVDHHFYQENALALDLAAWYWHFVDLVWIFVYVIVYWWGGR